MATLPRSRAQIVLLLPLLASPVRAEEPQRTTLSWLAPATCPQAPSFLAQVEHLLGQPLALRRDQSMHVDAVVTPVNDGFVARLQLSGRQGTKQRELTHQNCAELSEAAALITALAIDPTLALPEPASPSAAPIVAVEPAPAAAPSVDALPTTPVPTIPTASAAPPSPERVVRPAPPSKPSKPLQASLIALGLFGTGLLPDVGLGVGAAGTLGVGPWRFGMTGQYWLPRFHGVEGAAGPGIELGAWGVGAKACALPLRGDIALATCVGPQVGSMHGAGNEQLLRPRTERDRWSLIAADVSLVVSANSGVATLLGVEIGKTLEAPRFGIVDDSGARPVFEANSWTVSGFVGVGRFR